MARLPTAGSLVFFAIFVKKIFLCESTSDTKA